MFNGPIMDYPKISRLGKYLDMALELKRWNDDPRGISGLEHPQARVRSHILSNCKKIYRIIFKKY